MNQFGIPQPCNEDFSKMTLTERGAFCSKCSTDTFNFTNKSHTEIKSILRDHIGQEICGRILPEQIAAINADFEQWSFRSKKSFQSAFVFTLIAVFGLSLFSCQDQKQEADIINFQHAAQQIATVLDDQVSLETAANGLADQIPQIDLTGVLPLELISSDFQWMVAGAMEIPASYGEWLQEPIKEPVFVEPIIYEYEVPELVSETEIGPQTLISAELIAYPNPSSGITNLEFKNLEKGRYQIDLYDMNGKHYQDIYSGQIDEAVFREQFDMSELPVGMYLVTVVSKDFKQTIRVSKI